MIENDNYELIFDLYCPITAITSPIVVQIGHNSLFCPNMAIFLREDHKLVNVCGHSRMKTRCALWQNNRVESQLFFGISRLISLNYADHYTLCPKCETHQVKEFETN